MSRLLNHTRFLIHRDQNREFRRKMAMHDPTIPASPRRKSIFFRIAPGIQALAGYRRDWFKYDLIAGVSVAAVALPTAIAYAEIVGLEPVFGLYTAIPALLAYAVFGTSRHLIVNPDAATCAMIAAALAPLAAGDSTTLVSLSVVLAIFAGLLCLVASTLRLGFLADFLSKPILVGFLNGVAISIFLGQIGKIFGFQMTSHGIIPSLLEFLDKVPKTKLPTLAVGLIVIAVMHLSKRFLPRCPSPLLAVVAAIAVVKAFGLETAGVQLVKEVPAGLPHLQWPKFDPRYLQPLFGGAMGVALVSFCNAMVVARSFAAKNKYEIDADRELAALGASQLAVGLCQGFAVSGTESRTAMNHAMGAKSQLAGFVAAVAMAVVLLFLTGPLRYLPKAALGGILIFAALGLFDLKELRFLWRVSRAEFAIAMLTMVGVIALDVLEGILMAVTVALLLLLKRSARPPGAILVRVPGIKGFHDAAHYPEAPRTPGVLIYRFGAGIVFYNAAYLKKRIVELATAESDLKLLVLDGGTVNAIDSTGAETIEAIAVDLKQRGMRLALAGFRTEAKEMLVRTGVMAVIGTDCVFPTLKSAANAIQSLVSGQISQDTEGGDVAPGAHGGEKPPSP
jgi:high affinity sulfate transporter 1